MEDLGAFKIKIKNEINDFDLILNNAKRLPLNQKRNNYIVVGSRSHMSKETEDFFEKKKKENSNVEMLSIGSSLKICMVSEGSADVYPRYAPTMEWDTAAGHAIANMSGYKIFEFQKDQEIRYNKENLLNPWFLVTKNES